MTRLDRISKGSFFFFFFFFVVFDVFRTKFSQVSLSGQLKHRSEGGITDATLRRQLVAVVGLRGGLDRVVGHDLALAFDILRSDLKAVEEEAGAACVESRRAERVQNPGEGQLDGSAIFEKGSLIVQSAGAVAFSGRWRRSWK